MVDFVATTYASPADLKIAVDAIDNTAIIHVIAFMESGRQKFMLVA